MIHDANLRKPIQIVERSPTEAKATALTCACSSQSVGTIACGVTASEGHLRAMAVLPDWHGTEVAAALLHEAENDLRQNNCTVVRLDATEPLKRAIRFYEKLGFVASGKVPDFFGMRLYEYSKRL